MMKTYDKYKPSGIDWIGDVPEHWNVKRLKWICAFEYGNSLSSDSRQSGEIPVFGSNGITGYHTKAITTSPCIVVGRKGSFGKINWSDCECFPIDTTYFIDEHRTRDNLRWLYYLLQTLKLDSFSKDTGVPGLSREEAYSKISPYPPLPEQTAIAKYLDDKTAQIDKLIDSKQRVIELLEEERLGIINQAVTRGINLHAKLKPPGIDWLGDIPEHWEVKKLKFLTHRIGDGIHSTPIYDDDSDIFFINGNNLIHGTIFVSEMTRRVDENEYTKFKIDFKPDTVFLSINGTIGNLAFYNNEKIVLGKSAAYIECDNRLNKRFAFYVLQSNYVLDNFEISLSGTTIKNLSLHTLKNAKVAIPTVEEQKQIVQFIETETGQLDATISKIEKEIEYLQEYRTALISEVVTGKIKVV